jgi:hypothetical protein
MKKFTDKINESVEEKIPTASEWLESFGADADDMYYKQSVEEAMIEFAKLHVEAALKAANKEVIENDDLQGDCYSGRHNMKDCYSVENIK